MDETLHDPSYVSLCLCSTCHSERQQTTWFQRRSKHESCLQSPLVLFKHSKRHHLLLIYKPLPGGPLLPPAAHFCVRMHCMISARDVNTIVSLGVIIGSVTDDFSNNVLATMLLLHLGSISSFGTAYILLVSLQHIPHGHFSASSKYSKSKISWKELTTTDQDACGSGLAWHDLLVAGAR